MRVIGRQRDSTARDIGAHTNAENVKETIKVCMNGKRRLKVLFEALGYSDAAGIEDRERLI